LADYFTYLTIPAGTTPENPVRAEVEIEGDVLVGIYRLIPPGWCGLAHYRVLHGIYQLHPANPDEWDTGDNVSDFVPLNWLMPESKLKLVVEGYNEDEVYDHTIFLWFRTERLEQARPFNILYEIRDILKEALGLE